MWCNVCQSDVAIEVGADHRRVTCSTCGTVLGETAVSRETEWPATESQTDRVTEARDLLDRWASNQLLDPFGPPKKSVSAESATAETPVPRADATSEERVESPLPADADDSQIRPADDTVAADSGPASESRPIGDKPRWDAPHASVRPPINLNRREEGLRGSRPHDESKGSGGVTEMSHRPRAAPSSPARNEAKTHQPTQAASEADDLAASAAELDRLTNEILSRVSRITSQRDAERLTDESAASAPSAEVAESTDVDVPVDEIEEPAVSASQAEQADARQEYAEESASRDWDVDTATADADDIASNSEEFRPSDELTDQEIVPRQSAPRPHATAFTQRIDTSHRVTEPHSNFAQQTKPAAGQPSEEAEVDSANWFGGIGQGLAWLGILGLTAGTSLVIVGYFGGPATYAPMGWLISTIGQMLLFLGIVTLVSSGMEQTTQEVRRTVNEVSRKLDLIDNRIIRIEAAEPPGPPRPHIAERMVKASSAQRSRQEAARR
ncbi:MAG: hypothetical protein ACYTGL_01975 [Planctomycetota bacterium]|jgi:transcription initiation factor TFIIIB Brf1 subunit/transcription initiation factor TFIIB